MTFVEALGLNECHCLKTLHKLVNEGLFKITGKRHIFYLPTQLLIKPYNDGQHSHDYEQHSQNNTQCPDPSPDSIPDHLPARVLAEKPAGASVGKPVIDSLIG